MLSVEHRQFQPHTHTLSYCRSNLYFNQSMFHNIMNIHFSRCCSFHAVLRFPLIDFVKTVNWSKFVRKTWVIGRYWRVHVFKSISYICIWKKFSRVQKWMMIDWKKTRLIWEAVSCLLEFLWFLKQQSSVISMSNFIS